MQDFNHLHTTKKDSHPKRVIAGQICTGHVSAQGEQCLYAAAIIGKHSGMECCIANPISVVNLQMALGPGGGIWKHCVHPM